MTGPNLDTKGQIFVDVYKKPNYTLAGIKINISKSKFLFRPNVSIMRVLLQIICVPGSRCSIQKQSNWCIFSTVKKIVPKIAFLFLKSCNFPPVSCP